MAPYQNARYWLNDFHRGGCPNTKEEVFNKAHSKLKNVIKCVFRVLKARFRILKSGSIFIWIAKKGSASVFYFYNFLWKISIDDLPFPKYDNESSVGGFDTTSGI